MQVELSVNDCLDLAIGMAEEARLAWTRGFRHSAVSYYNLAIVMACHAGQLSMAETYATSLKVLQGELDAANA